MDVAMNNNGCDCINCTSARSLNKAESSNGCIAGTRVNDFLPVDDEYPFVVESRDAVVKMARKAMEANDLSIDAAFGTDYEFSAVNYRQSNGRQTNNINGKLSLQPNPREGVYCFDTNPAHTFRVVYSKRSEGLMFCRFRSREAYESLVKQYNAAIRSEADKRMLVKSKTPVFTYGENSYGWSQDTNYKTMPRSFIVGYDHYVEEIVSAIRSHQSNTEFLESIGENKSINFLLYGAPGQGKSSIVRIVASELGLPIFIVKPGRFSVSDITKVLNPDNLEKQLGEQSSNSDDDNDDNDNDNDNDDAPKPAPKRRLKLVVFEDFDRFLGGISSQSIMSEFLNSLDGITNSNDVVRIFTGNDCSLILNNEALINRVAGRFKFTYPTLEMYRTKLQQILKPGTQFDEADVAALIKIAEDNKVTMRPFITHAVRFLFVDNPVKAMLDAAPAQFVIEHVDGKNGKPKKTMKMNGCSCDSGDGLCNCDNDESSNNNNNGSSLLDMLINQAVAGKIKAGVVAMKVTEAAASTAAPPTKAPVKRRRNRNNKNKMPATTTNVVAAAATVV